MQAPVHRSAAWNLFIAVLVALTGSIPVLQAKEGAPKQSYTETIAVLQMLYGAEVRARERYLAFADAAIQEGHVNIAHLFKAIAASENVHAGNFSRILKSLGHKAAAVDLTTVVASTTQENLKYATEVELSEIDTEYPRYIHRVSPELHKEALEYINYAWEAERMHRELIKQIESGTGVFFKVLVERFQNNPKRYYVNLNCGATVTELPPEVCPVCYKPLDTYIEIPSPAKSDK